MMNTAKTIPNSGLAGAERTSRMRDEMLEMKPESVPVMSNLWMSPVMVLRLMLK